jgi:hypothetical protein
MINNENIKTMDPFMLLSIINMKLRDNYSSLEGLCTDLDIEVEVLIKRLDEVGYIYNKGNNQFIGR